MEPSDTRLDQEITFLSDNRGSISNSKEMGTKSQYPRVTNFDMAIDVIDDDIIEGDESLILAIEGYPELEPAKATIIDNDFGCGDNLIQNGDLEISNQRKSTMVEQ